MTPSLASRRRPASARAFGIVASVVIAIIALRPLVSGAPPKLPWLAALLIVVLVTWVRPAWLQPVNRVWTSAGVLLHRITSPIVLSILFYGCVTPLGWLSRRWRGDVLRLRQQRAASTYWEPRPPEAGGADMTRQF